MKKIYLSRSQSRFWSAELPVGDPTGGAAYGEKCDPATLAFGAAASGGTAATAGLFGVGGAFSALQTVMTVGAAISTMGAINQGQQANQAAQYNAAIANNNAIAARNQAAANAAAQQRKARLQMGSIRAGYGASGVTLEGSPMDILEQSAMNAEMDRQNILYGGELRASGYESTAGLELMRGEHAVTSSYYNAGSSLLRGAAQSGMLDRQTSTSGGYPRGNNPDEWNDYELRRTG